MKRRSFLWFFAAIGLGFLVRERKPFRFFWVEEESEVFVARDIDQINRVFRDERWGDELLTPENEGEIWGYADPTNMVHDQDTRETLTYADAFEKWGLRDRTWFQRDEVAQIATSYA